MDEPPDRDGRLPGYDAWHADAMADPSGHTPRFVAWLETDAERARAMETAYAELRAAVDARQLHHMTMERNRAAELAEMDRLNARAVMFGLPGRHNTMGIDALARREAEQTEYQRLRAAIDDAETGYDAAVERRRVHSSDQDWFVDAAEDTPHRAGPIPLGVYRWDLRPVYAANPSPAFNARFTNRFGNLWPVHDVQTQRHEFADHHGLLIGAGYCVLGRRGQNYWLFTRNRHYEITDVSFLRRWTAVHVPDVLPSALMLPRGVGQVLTDPNYYPDLASVGVGEDAWMAVWRRYANGHAGQGDPGHPVNGMPFNVRVVNNRPTLNAFWTSDLVRRATLMMSVTRAGALAGVDPTLPELPEMGGALSGIAAAAQTRVAMNSTSSAQWVTCGQ